MLGLPGLGKSWGTQTWQTLLGVVMLQQPSLTDPTYEATELLSGNVSVWYTYISRWWFQPLVKWSNLTCAYFLPTRYTYLEWVDFLEAWLSHMIWAESSSQQGRKHCKLASWISTGSSFIKYVEWTVIGEVSSPAGIIWPAAMKPSDNFWSQKSISRAVSLQIACLFQELVQRHHFLSRI